MDLLSRALLDSLKGLCSFSPNKVQIDWCVIPSNLPALLPFYHNMVMLIIVLSSGISFWAQLSCEIIYWHFSNFYSNFLYQCWMYNVWLDALLIITSNTCRVPAKVFTQSVWYPEQLNPHFRQISLLAVHRWFWDGEIMIVLQFFLLLWLSLLSFQNYASFSPFCEISVFYHYLFIAYKRIL